MVNLIDHRRGEGDLESHIRGVHGTSSLSLSLVSYVAFDFHAECANLKWDRLATLVARTRPTLARDGFLMVGADGSVNSRQRGAVRTNCMDCLDR